MPFIKGLIIKNLSPENEYHTKAIQSFKGSMQAPYTLPIWVISIYFRKREKKNPTKLTLYSKVSGIWELFNHFVCYPGFSAVSFSCGFVLVLLISTSPREWAGAGKKEIKLISDNFISQPVNKLNILRTQGVQRHFLVALIKRLVGEEVKTNGNIEIFLDYQGMVLIWALHISISAHNQKWGKNY